MRIAEKQGTAELQPALLDLRSTASTTSARVPQPLPVPVNHYFLKAEHLGEFHIILSNIKEQLLTKYLIIFVLSNSLDYIRYQSACYLIVSSVTHQCKVIVDRY